jgi:hypothetical protein
MVTFFAKNVSGLLYHSRIHFTVIILRHAKNLKIEKIDDTPIKNLE